MDKQPDTPRCDCKKGWFESGSSSRWLTTLGTAVVISIYGIQEFSSRTEQAVRQEGADLQTSVSVPLQGFRDDGQEALRRLEVLEKLDPEVIERLSDLDPQVIEDIRVYLETLTASTATSTVPTSTTPTTETTPPITLGQ